LDGRRRVARLKRLGVYKESVAVGDLGKELFEHDCLGHSRD
jgi:hypothetical protein